MPINKTKGGIRRREGRKLARIRKKLWEGRSILGRPRVSNCIQKNRRREEGGSRASESVRRLNKNKNKNKNKQKPCNKIRMIVDSGILRDQIPDVMST